jgi:prepilin-type N-terminal cleavage/methylation domain-containing protein
MRPRPLTRKTGRERGFSLPEMMIALGLASIVSAGLLMLTRTQLQAFQQNDQINRAQQNTRAGMAYVENVLRRACGGMSQGAVSLNVPGVTPVILPCLRFHDGVSALNAGGYTSGSPTTAADAVEVVYGYGSITSNTGTLSVAGIAVRDTTGFKVGDFVLVTDRGMTKAALFKLQSVTAGVAPAGTLNFATPGGAYLSPGVNLLGGADSVFVLRAKSLAFYVNTDNTSANFNALMYDPDGMAGTDHATDEPLVENVDDFQIAVGFDNDATGTLTDSASASDEWVGNATGETAINVIGPPPDWAKARQIRIGLRIATASRFSGAATAELALENRPATTPNTTGGNPRWRPLRMVVAPRAWNLAE